MQLKKDLLWYIIEEGIQRLWEKGMLVYICHLGSADTTWKDVEDTSSHHDYEK